MSALLLCLAVATVFTGAKMAQHSEGGAVEDEFVELGTVQILLMPILSSAVLLLLYFHFWLLQYVLLAFLFVASFNSVTDAVRYLTLLAFPASSPFRSPAGLLVSAISVYFWLVHGNWIAHDVIGCSLVLTFISVLRFPSLKLAALALSLLFVYDFFWVFMSEGFFHKNVMVSVATSKAQSPIGQLARLHIPIVSALASRVSAAPTVELPLKLLMPTGADGEYNILGLGDMAMPGILVSLALRMDGLEVEVFEDAERGEPSPHTAPPPARLLFPAAMLGYALGLSGAFVASSSWGPQPALIYIVPCALTAVCVRAAVEGRLGSVWRGVAVKEKTGE